MSESIMALKALRDAAQRRSHDGRPLRCGNGGPETGCECRMCWLDRAIAYLEATEQAQQPAPADVPPMPHSFHPFPAHPLAVCEITDVESLHAACVRIARQHKFSEAMRVQLREKYDRTRRELEAERACRPGSINAMTITSLRERLAEAEAALAALKGQEPVATLHYSAGWLVQWSPDCKPFPGNSLTVYAAPVPPPDSVPREQVEAALAQARREAGWSLVGAAQQAVLALGYDTECRIRNAISKDCGCAGCHRKWAKERLEAAIRALAEGGEVGK